MRNLGQALWFEITAFMTPCINLWQCCCMSCDTELLTFPPCFYKANITGDWEAASSHSFTSIVPVLQPDSPSWEAGLVALQFHLSSQRQHYYIECCLVFFKSFQGFTVLKQYFCQSDIFLTTFTLQGSCWVHASSANHSVFRKISGKMVLQNCLNKKQISN